MAERALRGARLGAQSFEDERGVEMAPRQEIEYVCPDGHTFTVTMADEDDVRRTVTLVGDDEQDASAGQIGWSAPLARALRGAAVGDLRRVILPGGEKEWEVLAISYP